MERLSWLETVFATVDPRVSQRYLLQSRLTNTLQDPEIREVAPRIMDVLSQRLEGEYMRISIANPQDPTLRKIPALVRHARELKNYVCG